jgi:hypothetical protein
MHFYMYSFAIREKYGWRLIYVTAQYRLNRSVHDNAKAIVDYVCHEHDVRPRDLDFNGASRL